MRTLRAASLCAILGVSASTIGSDDIPLSNWSAPPYWSPASGAADGAAPAVPAMENATRQALALPSSPLPFVAIAPCRQYDSRSVSPLLDNTPRTVTLTGAPCGIPPTAQAAAVNITVFNITGAGSNGVLKVGVASPPVTAWINYPPTETQRANAGVVALTAAGAIVLQVNQGAGSIDFTVDVAGYYASIGIVNSLNALNGDLTLAPGMNVSITPSGGNTLTIAAAGGGAPTGPAGGSLTGSYPNPGIASGAVGPTQLANATAVRSINGAAQDLVTIQGSGAVSVGTAGSTVTIGAPSGSMVLGAPDDTTLIGAGYTQAGPTSIYFWMPTTTSNSPPARAEHTAVWTGTRMIVWGGFDYSVGLYNDGGLYDPVANSWTATATAGSPSARWAHTAVWTGTRMIVWGGENFGGDLNDGGRYDPVGDSWTATALAGAPAPRDYHTAVWTGTKMIVWGGITHTGSLNTGGQYDPGGDSWLATTTSGAPQARSLHTSVWSGTKMIVWGGWDGSTHFGDGGQYEPTGDSWSATTTAGAPSGRRSHTAVWTGARMIVWGGYSGTTYVNDGGLYEPIGNAWAGTATGGAPAARYMHTASWTGSKMVVWGGIGIASPYYLDDGSQYEPATNSWSPMSIAKAPAGRANHTAVWTGSRMIVWGGFAGSTFFNSGGQWTPVSLYVKN